MSQPRAIGTVIHYWTNLGVAGVELTDTLSLDSWIHVFGTTTDFQQRVTSMQHDHQFIAEAHAGQQVGILMADRVRKGDTLFLLEDS